MERMEKEFEKTGKPMDLVLEVQKIYVENILKCAFGKDFDG